MVDSKEVQYPNCHVNQSLVTLYIPTDTVGTTKLTPIGIVPVEVAVVEITVVPLTVTVISEFGTKLDPDMVTDVPTDPPPGLRLIIGSTTKKSVEAEFSFPSVAINAIATYYS